ncbi:unnamed protein product [Lota lota]
MHSGQVMLTSPDRVRVYSWERTLSRATALSSLHKGYATASSPRHNSPSSAPVTHLIHIGPLKTYLQHQR